MSENMSREFVQNLLCFIFKKYIDIVIYNMNNIFIIDYLVSVKVSNLFK